MTVDKDIMEFEKKGLGNSEKVMDFLALGGVRTLPCSLINFWWHPCIVHVLQYSGITPSVGLCFFYPWSN
jgi:hypothetical protein